MKSLLIISAIAMSFNSFAGEYLLKETFGSGFSPVPMGRVTSILETGKVTEVKTVKGKKSAVVLKVLSPNTIQEIKDAIDDLKSTDTLVDLDANKPRCMDAPSTTLTVLKGKKEIVISARHSCHTEVVKSKAAEKLISLFSKSVTK
jgi:hypothetical protein